MRQDICHCRPGSGRICDVCLRSRGGARCEVCDAKTRGTDLCRLCRLDLKSGELEYQRSQITMRGGGSPIVEA